MAKNFKYRGRRRFEKKEDPHKINERIRAQEVRVIADGVEPKVYSLSEALKFAEDAGLDLVEISPNAKPPVCKIIDYKKFLYTQKKKKKEIKANTQKISIKEIRFGPNTDEHDFNFKAKYARNFIEDGAKVKAFVFFKGRTIVFKERGQILLLKLAQEIEDIATVESMPKMEGKRMIMFLIPKKHKSK